MSAFESCLEFLKAAVIFLLHNGMDFARVFCQSWTLANHWHGIATLETISLNKPWVYWSKNCDHEDCNPLNSFRHFWSLFGAFLETPFQMLDRLANLVLIVWLDVSQQRLIILLIYLVRRLRAHQFTLIFIGSYGWLICFEDIHIQETNCDWFSFVLNLQTSNPPYATK